MTDTGLPDQPNAERDRWDARFTSDGYIFGEAPNAFLKRTILALKPKGPRVLAVADGEGRNGVWLAEQGYKVDSVDFSAVAVTKAQALAKARGVKVYAEVADLFAWDWPKNTYDIVVVIFTQFTGPAGRAKLFANVRGALKPGGLLLLEGYGPKQIDYGTGGPKAVENLYTEDVLREAFGDFMEAKIAAYDAEINEGAGHSGLSALVDFVGRKPKA